MKGEMTINMTELEKMIAGELYKPSDEELVMLRQKAHRLCTQYNMTFETDEATRCAILKELLPDFDDEQIYFQGPIYFDYGLNTHIGKNFYANFNITILDVCPVHIGDNVKLGTNVSLVTPVHPLRWQERNPIVNENGEIITLEYAKPITIGDNCWMCLLLVFRVR